MPKGFKILNDGTCIYRFNNLIQCNSSLCPACVDINYVIIQLELKNC